MQRCKLGSDYDPYTIGYAATTLYEPGRAYIIIININKILLKGDNLKRLNLHKT
jgi:hypothetical protein